MRACEFIIEGSVYGQQKFDTQLALAKMQSNLAKQRPAQTAPAVAPEPVKPAPQPQSAAALQQQYAKFEPIFKARKDLETIKQKLTRGGRELPPNLAADLEDYYTLDDIKQYPEEVLAKYQRQLAQIQKYYNLKQALKK